MRLAKNNDSKSDFSDIVKNSALIGGKSAQPN
jgi:hypothetical protein